MSAAPRIAIDARMLRRVRTGIGRYLHNLLLGLNELGNQRYLLIGNVLSPAELNMDTVPAELPMGDVELANKILALTTHCADLDLLHSPFHPIPETVGCKRVLTILDLIGLRHPEWFKGTDTPRLLDGPIRRSAQSADHIIAISQATKDDVVELFGIEPDRITVTPLGVDLTLPRCAPEERQARLEKLGIADEYLLSVCTIEPRKNLDGVLRAYEAVRAESGRREKLVLVGRLGWDYDRLLETIQTTPYRDDVVITGYVDEATLSCLYSGAAAFVYPSYYEGFGLPVLEAMRFRVPVVTSNTSSLPEVGGDTVYYCDPRRIDSIADALLASITDPQREARIAAAYQRSLEFSWENTARLTESVYRRCINSG